MIAIAGDLLAWARESLGAGDAPEEVAREVGLTVEQLLAAAGVRRPMSGRQREAAAAYASGMRYADMAEELGCTQAGVCRLLETARGNGYVIPLRRLRQRAVTDQRWCESARAILAGSALGRAVEAGGTPA